MENIDPKIIRDFFDYTPETGELRWRIGNKRRKKGELAGVSAANEKGRITVGFKGILIRAHILIWAYQTGNWPNNQIDHINENPADNRWENLRLATKSENMRNITLIKSNTSGFKGVGWSKASKKWRSYIKADGVSYHLGLFDTKEEAAKAYIDASKKLHGIFSKHQNLPST